MTLSFPGLQKQRYRRSMHSSLPFPRKILSGSTDFTVERASFTFTWCGSGYLLYHLVNGDPNAFSFASKNTFASPLNSSLADEYGVSFLMFSLTRVFISN